MSVALTGGYLTHFIDETKRFSAMCYPKDDIVVIGWNVNSKRYEKCRYNRDISRWVNLDGNPITIDIWYRPQ